jgi:hypothetical protein
LRSRVVRLGLPCGARPPRRCATPARRARTSAEVQACGNGRPAPAMRAGGPAGEVGKMLNLQPVAALERALAPRKTQALATRPAADRVRLWFLRTRVGIFPARALVDGHPIVTRFALSSRLRCLLGQPDPEPARSGSRPARPMRFDGSRTTGSAGEPNHGKRW